MKKLVASQNSSRPPARFLWSCWCGKQRSRRPLGRAARCRRPPARRTTPPRARRTRRQPEPERARTRRARVGASTSAAAPRDAADPTRPQREGRGPSTAAGVAVARAAAGARAVSARCDASSARARAGSARRPRLGLRRGPRRRPRPAAPRGGRARAPAADGELGARGLEVAAQRDDGLVLRAQRRRDRAHVERLAPPRRARARGATAGSRWSILGVMHSSTKRRSAEHHVRHHRGLRGEPRMVLGARPSGGALAQQPTAARELRGSSIPGPPRRISTMTSRDALFGGCRASSGSAACTCAWWPRTSRCSRSSAPSGSCCPSISEPAARVRCGPRPSRRLVASFLGWGSPRRRGARSPTARAARGRARRARRRAVASVAAARRRHALFESRASRSASRSAARAGPRSRT